MCGRITLTHPDVEEVARLLEAEVLPSDSPRYRPRYNAAPTDEHWIVVPSATGRVLVPALWGFKGGVINARAETADRRFTEAFYKRRVIVAADGFFEWTGPRDDRRPLWFRPRSGGLLHLAGLAEELPDGRLAFVILTTEAAGPVAQVHDRMPVVLPREKISLWLQKPDSALLVPAPDDFLVASEVSRKVNDVKNDDASLLVADPPRPRSPEQLGLFGI
jgi:putative SOS response-associated peptidase YedK